MVRFLRTLFTRKEEWTALEQHVLLQVQSHLQPAAAKLFLEQIEEVDIIRRYAGGKEIIAARRGKRLQAPNKALELKLAILKIQILKTGKTINAEVFLGTGFFGSIEFDRDPQSHTPPFLTDVKICADPLEEVAVESPHVPEAQTVELKNWAADFHPIRTYKPLPADSRAKLLRSIDAKLPDDYLALLEQSDGLVIEGCSVMGLSEVYEHTEEMMNYYLIAELHDTGMLAIEKSGRNGEVTYLAYDRGKSVFPSLREA